MKVLLLVVVDGGKGEVVATKAATVDAPVVEASKLISPSSVGKVEENNVSMFSVVDNVTLFSFILSEAIYIYLNHNLIKSSLQKNMFFII